MSDAPAENAPAAEPINEESENAENVTQQREQSEREQVLEQYRAKIREHREVEARLKRMREDVKGLTARYQKTEDDLSALQSVGQIIGDVLKRLDAERFIVKASSGPRYVVGCRARLNHGSLKPGTRVALDMTTLTIMRVLPREVDPTVFHMQAGEEDGGVSFADIGGLNEQIRELREVIELPLTNPELFIRVGIKVGNIPYMNAIKHGACSGVSHTMLLPSLLYSSLINHRLPRVSCCTDPQELERLCSPVHWLATLLPPFSKSSPLPL
jgi:ATP-dependent 26S proteasome regulatory subunit